MYQIGNKLKYKGNWASFTIDKIYEIATQKLADKKFIIFDDNNTSNEFTSEMIEYHFVLECNSINNGGSTDYYKLPSNAKDLQDLIEDKEMNWNIANIFKSCYRLGQQNHSNAERDINKIIWFAERYKQLLKKKIL